MRNIDQCVIIKFRWNFPTSHNKKIASNLAKSVNHELGKVYSENFEKYVEKLNPKDGSFWKYAKRLKNKPAILPQIKHNNEVWTSDQDKANGFVEHLSSISKSRLNLGSKHLQIKFTAM